MNSHFHIRKCKGHSKEIYSSFRQTTLFPYICRICLAPLQTLPALPAVSRAGPPKEGIILSQNYKLICLKILP